MDLPKHITRELVMPFVVGVIAQAIGAATLIWYTATTSDVSAWSGTTWGVIVAGGVFIVLIIALMSAHSATESQEKRIDAALAGLPGQIKSAVDAARAEIEARAQGQLDLKVREERITATEKANGDAQQRFDQAVATINAETEKLRVEVSRFAAQYDLIKTNVICGIVARDNTHTLAAALRAAGWDVSVDNDGRIQRVTPPSKAQLT